MLVTLSQWSVLLIWVVAQEKPYVLHIFVYSNLTSVGINLQTIRVSHCFPPPAWPLCNHGAYVVSGAINCKSCY